MIWTPRTLRARLSWAVLVPALLVFSALIWLAIYAARVTLEDEVGVRLEATAAAIAANLPTGTIARFSPEKTRTHANLAARLSRAREATGARRIFLVRLDGISWVDTAADAPAPGQPDRGLAEDRFELGLVAEGRTAASVLFRGLDGVRYKRGFAPVVHEGAVVAVLGVEAGAESFEALDALSTYLLVVGGLGAVLLAAVVLLFSRAVTAPLGRLVLAARRMGGGELDAPVEVGGGTAELVELGASMDEMREALRRRDREMQLMLGGIAHEIRNPLGGMELFVGLLREDLDGRDEELSLLARVETELGTLKRIVEEFLEYARHRPVEPEHVPLAELVFEVACLVDISLVCSAPLDHAIRGERQRLRRLLLNMARNAAQAGASGLWVEVEGAGLVLRDDGAGVSDEVAARLFDAFYTTREKGTGLGLALCRRIALAHGGDLRLLNPGEPGARFQLELWTSSAPSGIVHG